MVEYNAQAEKARFKELLEAAQDELVDAVKNRNMLEMRIRSLQSDITHLAALCGEEVQDPIKDLGLTDAIRYTLGNTKGPMTPVEIKEALVKGGFEVSEYSNMMASIHTVLRRLRIKGEVMASGFKGGSFIWTKRGLTPPPPLPGWIKERLK